MDECTLDGGVPFLNKCFKEMEFVETIEEARRSCINEGKSLFMLDSDQESKFIDDLLRYDHAWVGATYNEGDDTMLWDDGKSTFLRENLRGCLNTLIDYCKSGKVPSWNC